jgi:hypothetical protein
VPDADASTEVDPAALVLRYYAHRATTSFGFLAPVWVVLLEARGLSFTAIAMLDAVYFGTLVLAEVPTGYLGDRIGRRNALAVGTAGVALSAVGFGYAETVPGFLLDYVAWGIAETMRSGNGSAWLYDALDDADAADTFATVRGRGDAVFFGVTAVAALTGGYLATRDLTLPFLATGALNGVGALVVLTLPPAGGGDADESDRLTLGVAARGVTRLVRPPLRWTVAYVGLFLAVGWSADIYVQPVTTRAGVSLVGLGGLYAVLTGGSALAGQSVGRIRGLIGGRRALRAVPLVVGAGYLLGAAAPLAALPAFVLGRAGLTLARPLAEQYLNDRLPSLGRATVLSGFSMLVAVLSVPLKFLSGPVADATSPLFAVGALGGGLLAAAGALLALRTKR